MSGLIVDINCDMGESYGRFKIGNDEAIFPYISSCNVACGFHGGDPYTIEKTIELALENKVRIGAHPSYPDLSGFGRRKMKLPANELKSIIKYQVAALYGLVKSKGGVLAYVKPHGALYNEASTNVNEAKNILEALKELNLNLVFMGKAGSLMEQVANKNNYPFIAEAFADRAYNEKGELMPRSQEGAVIKNPETAAGQTISIVLENKVPVEGNEFISIKADSICIHGDNPGVIEILKKIDEKLSENGIRKGYK